MKNKLSCTVDLIGLSPWRNLCLFFTEKPLCIYFLYGRIDIWIYLYTISETDFCDDAENISTQFAALFPQDGFDFTSDF
jgi:hypothetical protein